MKNILIRTLLHTTASIALSACGKPDPVASITGVDRVLTVKEYLAQPDLRQKVSAVCSDDPGRTGLNPNCVNVRRADHIAAFGSATDMPRLFP